MESNRPHVGPLAVLQSAGLLALTRSALVLLGFGTVLRLDAWLRARTRRRDTSSQADSPGHVGLAVIRAGRYVPGGRHCLTQALVARFLLARVGVPTRLRIGLAKGATGALTAHAWLERNGTAVFGLAPSQLQRYVQLPDLTCE